MAEFWPFDPRVKKLLQVFLKVAKSTGKPYAIGGGLALSAYGYTRQTTDVDAFVLQEDRNAWLFAARQIGLKVYELFAPFHYAATVPGEKDFEYRIDFMFSGEEQDLAAVDVPDSRTINGIRAKVFPMPLLVITKFMSDRPKDRLDFETLYDRGMFNPIEVYNIFVTVDEVEAERFKKAILKLSKKKTQKRWPRRNKHST